MQLFAAEELERVNNALQSARPIKAQTIDFKNPYFTQPKSVTGTSDAEFDRRLAGVGVQHLYVHVPFCMTHCVYCHYPTVTNVHTVDNQLRFMEQVEAELQRYVDAGLDFSGLQTVHVGGGTPNTLDHGNLERLMSLLATRFPASCEFAVELYPSPNYLDEEKMRIMRDHGVDRVSLGIQTFNDEVNERNRRIDQPREHLFRLIGLARQYFPNVSVDLLYGQKGQDLEMFRTDCETCQELDVNSVYLYQVRELVGNRFLDLQQGLNQFLHYYTNHGYEIVSFDQVIKKRNSDGFCAHRSGRSLSENLLGVGPGAVSELDHFIFRNRDPGHYMAEGHGIAPNSIVERPLGTLKAEYLNRAFRHFNDPCLNGMWRESYRARFGSDVLEDFGNELGFLAEHDLVTVGDDRLEVTDLGMHFTQAINYFLLGHYK